jgi:hypothetical protein
MELQQYKANRSAEIKAKYISLLNGVVNKYNRMIANVLNSRFILFKTVQ